MKKAIDFFNTLSWQMWLVAALSLAGLGTTAFDWLFLRPNHFWDLEVYQFAGNIARSGDNPYDHNYSGLRFVYSPAVLWLFSVLGEWVKPLFLTTYIAITVTFFLITPASLRVSMFFLFGVVIVADLVLRSAFTGNFTFFLHLLIVTLWLATFRKGRDVALLLTISIGALVKPYFAAYFLLWALRDGKLDRSSLWAAVALGLVVAFWVAQAVLAPDSFADFLAALDAQTQVGRAHADMGKGLFQIGYLAGLSGELALCFHLIISVGLVVGWLFWLRGPLVRMDNAATNWLLLTGPLILCLVLNPRFKVYDISVAFLLCVHAGYLWGRTRPGPPITPLLGMTLAILAIELIITLLGPADYLVGIQHGARLAVMLGTFALAARALAQRTELSAG